MEAVVQLLGLNVLPEKQHLGLGDQLLDLMLMRSELQGGVRQVAGITRCKNFRGQSLAESDGIHQPAGFHGPACRSYSPVSP